MTLPIRDTLSRAALMFRTLERQACEAKPKNPFTECEAALMNVLKNQKLDGGESSNFQPKTTEEVKDPAGKGFAAGPLQTRFPILGTNGEVIGYTFADGMPPGMPPELTDQKVAADECPVGGCTFPMPHTHSEDGTIEQKACDKTQAAAKTGSEQLWVEGQARDAAGRFASVGGGETASTAPQHNLASSTHNAVAKAALHAGHQQIANAHYAAADAHAAAASGKGSTAAAQELSKVANIMGQHASYATPGAKATETAPLNPAFGMGREEYNYRKAAALAASRQHLDNLVMQSAAVAHIEVEGPADDAELPQSLRGKGLIRGKPVALWPIGKSTARDGRIFVVDHRAVASLLADGNGGGQPVPFTYSHENAEADAGMASKNSGYMTHFSADKDFIYADKMYWTAAAAKDIASGERGFVSPDAYCQPLDPKTLEPIQQGARTNTYLPLYWRAASLVPVPALANLPPASLTTQVSADELLLQALAPVPPQFAKKKGMPPPHSTNHPPKPPLPMGATQPPSVAGATSGKEILPMDPEILAALGFAPGTTPTPAQVKAAILSLAGDSDGNDDASNGNDPTGTGAAPAGPAKGAAPADGGAAQHIHLHIGAGADEAKIVSAEDIAKGKELEVKEPTKDEITTQAAAAAAPAFSDVARQAAELASTKIKADMTKEALDAKIDGELNAFEKAGKLVAADREFFRSAYALDADKTRQTLEAHSRGVRVPDGEVFGGVTDASVSVDSLPAAEQNEILSRSAAFALDKGIEFPLALQAVRGGDPSERAFHSQVLACNPDWGKTDRGTKTGVRGVRWPTSIRKGYTSQELDGDMLKHIATQMKAGKISTTLVPQALQAAAIQRMSLAGEVSSFQPPTKFSVAGFGFGYFQGEFGGSEIAPEVTGGANEEASYPIYGTEKLSVHVNALGVPEAVGRNINDKERSYWGVDFKKVTLHGYGNEVWADRRDQSAGDAVLPQGVMATVTEQAMTIEKNKKELIQAAVLRSTASYAAGNQVNLNTGTRQWSNPLSTPIQDVQGARVAIWRACGAFPDITLMPPDVIETLRFHPDFLKAAQYAGMTHIDTPEALVPIEMLVAILGPLVVPTCRISTIPGGQGADTPWGQDVIMSVTSKGKVIAPRAFATVVSAGYPIVRGMVDERAGLNGSDGISVSDMYTVEVVTPSGLATTSAYLIQNAVNPLSVAPGA